MLSCEISRWFSLLTWELPGMAAMIKLKDPMLLYRSPTHSKSKSRWYRSICRWLWFGARSTLLGYFLRLDAAWEMNGLFKGKPQWYFAMGLDF